MGKGKTALAAILVVVAALLAAPGAAQAKGIKGTCGEHMGSLYRIDSGGAKYHVRFGPKRGHVGGSHRCHGIMFIRRSNGTASVDGVLGGWVSFDWLRWNLKTIIAVNGTASACTGFGLALAAEAPSGAVDTWLTASAGAGCVSGTAYIVGHYLTSGNGGTQGNYCGRFSQTCNAVARMH